MDGKKALSRSQLFTLVLSPAAAAVAAHGFKGGVPPLLTYYMLSNINPYLDKGSFDFHYFVHLNCVGSSVCAACETYAFICVHKRSIISKVTVKTRLLLLLSLGRGAGSA